MTTPSTNFLKFDVTGQAGAIPSVGLGTATLTGDRCREAVYHAIKAGYRHIDTALTYNNHKAVGEAIHAAIRDNLITRSDLFVTSKVAFFPEDSEGVWNYNPNNLKGSEASSIDACLAELGLEYLDLCLVHSPCVTKEEFNAACLPHFFELFAHQGLDIAISPARMEDGTNLRELVCSAKRSINLQNRDLGKARLSRIQSWRNMEAAVRSGKVKYIGVANYPNELLLEMTSYANIMPAINQLELHPRYSSPQLRETASKLGMCLTGYGTGNFVGLDCREGGLASCAADISTQRGISINRIILRWTIQNGVICIPRSGTPAHIEDNLDLFSFELTPEEMEKLDKLNQNYPYYWDPLPTVDTIASSISQ